MPPSLSVTVCFCEARALGVDRRAERVERLLGEVGAGRVRGRGGLEDLVGRGDRDRLVVERLVEQADAVRRRPDQRVDLVHLPRLVAGAELRALG